MAGIKRFFARKSLLRSFILSYTLVFLLPIIIIFTFFYRSSIRSVKEEIRASHASLVGSIGESLDKTVRDYQIILGFLNNDDILNNLIAKAEDELTPRDRLDIMGISEDLNRYTVSNSSLESVYVYLVRSDRVITRNNSMPGEDAFESLRETILHGADYHEWRDLMTGNSRGELALLETGEGGGTVLSYVSAIPLLPTYGNEYIKVIFQMADSLGGIVRDDLAGTLLLRNGEGEILYANRPSRRVSSADLSSGSAKATVELERTGGSLTYLLPEAVYMEDLNRIRLTSFLILFACLLTGGVLSYFFTMRNYSPLKKLIALSEKLGSAGGDDRDWGDFERIHEALNSGLNEKIAYENLMNRREREKKSRENFNRLFLDGETPASEIKAILEEAFPGDSRYALIAIDLQSPEENGDLAAGLLQELLGTAAPLLVFRSNSRIFGLTAFGNSDLSRLKEEVQRIHQFLEDSYALESFVAISGIKVKPEEVPSCLGEVRRVLEYLRLMGRTHIMAWDDLSIVTNREGLEKNFLRDEKAFTRALGYGNFAEAGEILDGIFEGGFFREVNQPQIVRFRLFSFMNRILDALMDLDIPDKETFIEELKPYSRILECSSASEWQRELWTLLEDLADYFEKHRADEMKAFSERIVRYVDDNFQDPNLNVSRIANVFDYNLEYLSRKFKQASGRRLLDHIHRVRIDRAKELLREERSITLPEAGERVGYSSIDTFLRAFKRIEGITPGEYRKKTGPE